MVVANAVDPIPVVVPEPIGGLIVILGADKYPDPAFVITTEFVNIAPPPTTTLANVPFQVESFCVSLLKTLTFKYVPLV